ncbi:MAG TPA: DEAD/DEAH box helicase, partial [Ktedonobacteraceae bacterium]
MLNPIQFASQVNKQFLDYQLTAFPLTDPDLAEQARTTLYKGLGYSPLIRGPYVSLSKSFQQGRDLNELARQGTVHPVLPALAPYPLLFAHQYEALRQVQAGQHCLIATGTGSGKTEAFLYPILDHCLRLRDENAPDGIAAVLVYPMNALAIDQLGRLRQMLVGSGISFGMYVGTTAADEGDLRHVVRLAPGQGRAAFEQYTQRYREHERVIISPAEERLTEKEMVQRPPRLLLTNVNQLELLLTRGKDLGMFMHAPLRYLVFDEAHTYTGAVGAEVSCLIRRLRAFCGKSADDVICIGTSATVTDLQDDSGEEAAHQFAHRFFGVNPQRVALVREQYETVAFPTDRYTPTPPVDSITLLEETLAALDSENESHLRTVAEQLIGKPLSDNQPWTAALYQHFQQNDYVYAIYQLLDQPLYLPEAVQRIQNLLGRKTWQVDDQTQRPPQGRSLHLQSDDQAKAELLCYLALGAAAEFEEMPLMRPKVHYFIKGLEGAVIKFVRQSGQHDFRAELYLSLSDAMQRDPVEAVACPPLLVCKNCGQHYLESYYRNFEFVDGTLSGADLEGNNGTWEATDETDGLRVLFTNRFISEIDAEDDLATLRLNKKRIQLYFCRHCGTLHVAQGNCHYGRCKRPGPLVPVWAIQLNEQGRLTLCPSCGQRSNIIGNRVIEPIKPL